MTAVAKHEPREVQVAPERSDNPMVDMVREAMRSGQSIEVIREVRALAKEMAADEAKRAFDEAVSDAKAEIQPIAKNKDGHNSRYADLGEISRQVDPILSKHGLSVRHRTRQDGNAITVTCILSHKLGHFEETELTANPDTSGSKNSIQAIGSTLTYLQRYTKVLAVGIAVSDDDDGQAGGGSGEVISDQQVMDLRELIESVAEAVNSTVPVYAANFLKFMKVERIEDIAAKDYQKAITAINSTRAGK